MLKSLSLTYKLYVSLALIMFFFAMLSIIGLYFFNKNTSNLLLIEQQELKTKNLMIQTKTLIESAINDINSWMILKDSDTYQTQKLKLSPAFSTIRVQLNDLEQITKDPLQKSELKLLSKRLTQFETNFHHIQNRLSGTESFKDSTAFNQSIQILYEKIIPIVEEIRRITQASLAKSDTEVKDKFDEFRFNSFYFNELIFIGVVLIALTMLGLGFYLIRIFIAPVFEIRDQLAQMALGDIPNIQLQIGDGELGEIAVSINLVTDNLRRYTDFAIKIGQGNFGAGFNRLGDEDTLGIALINMRQRLLQIQQREERRNWYNVGYAKFAEILRQRIDLNSLCDEIISNLARYLNTSQGAIFLVESDNPNEPTLNMVSSFAGDRNKLTQRSFPIGAGLVGQCARELEIIYLTKIPENYATLSTGLNEATPNTLLLIPLVSNDNLQGVIELISFDLFKEDEIDFIKKVGESVALVISTTKTNDNTLKLLNQSQDLSKQLSLKTEELEKNAKIMLATQLELTESNTKLAAQMDRLNQTASDLAKSEEKIQRLLENASEVITIFNKEGKVLYESPSIEAILGYQPYELLGETEFRNVYHEDIPKLKGMFQKLLSDPANPTTIEFRYRKKNGSLTWLETVGKNLLHDPSIEGIVTNTRDVTERRRADLNARRKLQFQSLSENSPDLIIRLDIHFRFLYVNPSIEKYTAQEPDYFIKNTLHNVGFSFPVIDAFEKIINDVQKSREKDRIEIVFPSNIGDRIMQLEVIPEFNLDNVIETVLIVAHDITEMKLYEQRIIAQNQKLEQINLEVLIQKAQIEEKNKDITESIEYAKRIQESILPDSRLLDHGLNQYFIFYRPKDIVSGDFYWFTQQENKTFLAVVDCTGHGVPGAFMSLIGYSLLNQIVKERGITEPAKILSELDRGVKEALRRDNAASQSKDGMDVCLIVIDSLRWEIKFAGANRPLYWWHQYDIIEIKGTKLSIGGIESEGIRIFEQHLLNIEKGDCMYLFSDGYVDQFGGPRNKKLTSKRFREIIIRNQHKSIAEQNRLFEKAFEEWKGDNNQVDDVALIGVRF